MLAAMLGHGGPRVDPTPFRLLGSGGQVLSLVRSAVCPEQEREEALNLGGKRLARIGNFPLVLHPSHPF